MQYNMINNTCKAFQNVENVIYMDNVVHQGISSISSNFKGIKNITNIKKYYNFFNNSEDKYNSLKSSVLMFKNLIEKHNQGKEATLANDKIIKKCCFIKELKKAKEIINSKDTIIKKNKRLFNLQNRFYEKLNKQVKMEIKKLKKIDQTDQQSIITNYEKLIIIFNKIDITALPSKYKEVQI